MTTTRCFLDFSIDGNPIGRVIIELFNSITPKAAENFRSLCTGSAGIDQNGLPLYYKGSILSKVIAGFMIQGGGKSTSIYGPSYDDEPSQNITSEGLICSANKGQKNTNGSQFFISLRPCPHLDGKNVVFGRVISGMDIVEGISKVEVGEKDVPVKLIIISNCGELVRRVPEKKRSITPDSEIESDGRSISPPPKKKSRSSKSSSKREKRPHRPRDENGKRIKSSKSTQLSSRSPSPLPQTPEQLQASLDLQESLKAEEVQRIKEKELNLIKLKERYEIRREKEGQDGDRMNYKGRGSMKAPSRNGSGGMRGFD